MVSQRGRYCFMEGACMFCRVINIYKGQRGAVFKILFRDKLLSNKNIYPNLCKDFFKLPIVS